MEADIFENRPFGIDLCFVAIKIITFRMHIWFIAIVKGIMLLVTVTGPGFMFTSPKTNKINLKNHTCVTECLLEQGSKVSILKIYWKKVKKINLVGRHTWSILLLWGIFWLLFLLSNRIRKIVNKRWHRM